MYAWDAIAMMKSMENNESANWFPFLGMFMDILHGSFDGQQSKAGCVTDFSSGGAVNWDVWTILKVVNEAKFLDFS
jgi:hypothetical protein